MRLRNLSENQFYGPNLGYVLELYERYTVDLESVDEGTRKFFERWGDPLSLPLEGQEHPIAGVEDPGLNKAGRVANIARSLRDFGHLAAKLDPLGGAPPDDSTLDPGFHSITEEDLEGIPSNVVGGPIAERTTTAREAVRELRRIYCGTCGYEFGHLRNIEERDWLGDAVESERYGGRLHPKDARRLLQLLTRVDTFERFLHKTFLGQKRFSLEGNDMVVPMLDHLVRAASRDGFPEVVMGTVSRGRLNVLAHLLGKPYAAIFSEFETPGGVEENDDEAEWVGDVKYHLGARGYYPGETEEESKVYLNLPPNPSHLEHIDPVAEGIVRAAQDRRDACGAPEREDGAALAILTHGDAAFSGEGIATETLNLSRLPGYTTGGTIHILVNNQIGFTTEPHEGRSTAYASDPSRGYEIPVIHVNADDTEACIAAVEIAYAYRQRFNRAFMIDLVGYRRWGHNEGDEPTYTQPVAYEKIRNHRSVREIWAEELERRGVVDEGEAERMVQDVWGEMDEIHKNPTDGDDGMAAGRLGASMADIPETGVARERLEALNASMLERPNWFNTSPKLERLLQKNRGNLEQIDWAHAEALAFASLLEEGVPVRITGQDTGRGTFSHRHTVLRDAKTGKPYVPLQSIPQATSSFAVHNSPLSELAAIGFEYGYSLNAPEALVLWEAQYGDFANVGQPITDQFIVSGQAKWGQESDLVLLLPHGHEGQGPEHTSARLERFLQLAADDNIRIANLTTAAQYFHLLRAQAILKDDRRPLIIMAPKSLLRNPMVASGLSDLSDGRFHPVLDDEEARERSDSIGRLILCSGKIYTELAGSEYREEEVVTAIGRVELLYPFPEGQIRAMIEGYPNLREILWVQEEPKNMGAWTFMEPRLRELVGGELPILYIGKPARPSPAQGSARFHKREHAQIVRAAIEKVGNDYGKIEAAVQGAQSRAGGPSD